MLLVKRLQSRVVMLAQHRHPLVDKFIRVWLARESSQFDTHGRCPHLLSFCWPSLNSISANGSPSVVTRGPTRQHVHDPTFLFRQWH
jgi:hypothetical protein